MQRKKIVLGLTGAFASGKTTVAGFFDSFGAKVIDADNLAHSLIRPGSKAYQKIIAIFGRGILKKDKSICRPALASVVFDDKNALLRLNRLIHPEVIRMIKQGIKQAKEKIVVLDAPLLLETGLGRIADKIIVVRAKKSQLIKRAKQKMHLDKADILKRIRAQMPLKKKVRLADFVIDNNGTRQETKKQAEKIWKEL